uniref:F-box domain-containing protein n=1 Tax=Aegilops tauschii subsp. strangulata TaxID=200361 RepID=A0A453GBL8_AEGTS
VLAPLHTQHATPKKKAQALIPTAALPAAAAAMEAAMAEFECLGSLGPITAVTNEFLREQTPHNENEYEEQVRRLYDPAAYAIPVRPPVSAAASLFALPPDDDVDRVSRLPDALLRDVVSRLPVKDAARTAALSHRWRGVWRSTPLVLHDVDLLPDTSAVSRVSSTRIRGPSAASTSPAPSRRASVACSRAGSGSSPPRASRSSSSSTPAGHSTTFSPPASWA